MSENEHLIVHRIVGERNGLLLGSTQIKQGDEYRETGKFVRSADKHWLSCSPEEITHSVGVPCTKRRSEELLGMFNGKLSVWYYLEASGDGTEEAAKLILGPIAAYLNEHSLGAEHIYQRMPADYLKAFVAAVSSGTIAKRVLKEAVVVLLDQGTCFEEVDPDEPLRRLTGDEVIARLVAMPKFQPQEAFDTLALVKQILEANPEVVAKIANEPKLVHWLVGQAMKAGKGKADAQLVREEILKQLG